jgi:hypothetical protein
MADAQQDGETGMPMDDDDFPSPPIISWARITMASEPSWDDANELESTVSNTKATRETMWRMLCLLSMIIPEQWSQEQRGTNTTSRRMRLTRLISPTGGVLMRGAADRCLSGWTSVASGAAVQRANGMDHGSWIPNTPFLQT